MLEIGCGMADILPYLPNSVRYWGIDPTEECIQKLKTEKPGYNFLIGYAENLPFSNNSFDLIFSVQVLEHVLDPQRSLKEMVRVLRTGGYLIVIAPNFETPWSTIAAVRHLNFFFQEQFSKCKDLEMFF